MVANPNWTSEFKLAYKNIKDLYDFLGWPRTPRLEEVARTYPLFIPRALAEKIKIDGPDGVLAKEFLPHLNELRDDLNSWGSQDPIGDEVNLRAPQLIHRYRSRALFTPTTICPVHCRYCFRKNELSSNGEIFHQDFEKTLAYLSAHPEISEIIFTGGDPLTLSDERLTKYLEAFSAIGSIKDVRFHTRYPVILPERIDSGFIALIRTFAKSFRTLSLAVHANHIRELGPEARAALTRLSKENVQLLSQTVLLKSVNDSSQDLRELMEAFIELKVRPYYLHHPDRVRGGMHFYLSLEEGRRIYQTLRNNLPGWAIPQYILDVPGGSGKIPAFNPESFSFSGRILTGVETTNLKEPDFSIYD